MTIVNHEDFFNWEGVKRELDRNKWLNYDISASQHDRKWLFNNSNFSLNKVAPIRLIEIDQLSMAREVMYRDIEKYCYYYCGNRIYAHVFKCQAYINKFLFLNTIDILKWILFFPILTVVADENKNSERKNIFFLSWVDERCLTLTFWGTSLYL